jgi:predicted outer membrane protein
MYSQDFNDVISNLNSAIAVLNANVQTTKAIQDRYQQMLATLADFGVQFDNYQKTMN